MTTRISLENSRSGGGGRGRAGIGDGVGDDEKEKMCDADVREVCVGLTPLPL